MPLNTVIRFAPGLKPVLKHGTTHNEADHGRRGGGSDAPISPERVAEAFNGTYQTHTGLEFTLVARRWGWDGDNIRVQGEILVGDQVVGKWVRDVSGTTMIAESLNVGKDFGGNALPDAEKYQGQGIALEVQKQTEKAARNLGCTEIKVSAINDGVAAWAQERFGYRFELKPDLRDNSKPGREPRTEEELAIPKGGMAYVQGARQYRGEDGLLLGVSHPDLGIPSVRNALAGIEERFKSRNPDDWPTPAEVVSLGTGRRVSDDIIQGKTLGEFLLSRGWSGIKSSDHVTKAAGGYMRVVVEGEKGAVTKHGIHDQSSHGNWADGNRSSGSGDLPDGWVQNPEESRIQEFIARQRAEGWTDTDEYLTKVYGHAYGDTDEYAGPNNTRVLVVGDAKVSATDLSTQLKTVADLQRIAPVQDLRVEIDDKPFRVAQLDDGVGGFVVSGGQTIYLRPSSVTDGIDLTKGNLMPVLDRKTYALVHEYGHVLDQRSDLTSSSDQSNVLTQAQTGMSRYAYAEEPLGKSGREAFAEAWTGWVGSLGRLAQPVRGQQSFVGYYAEKYGWNVGSEGVAPSAGFAKVRGRMIFADTFTDKKSVIHYLPEDLAIMKHAQHDQSTHGNWAHGSNTLTPTNLNGAETVKFQGSEDWADLEPSTDNSNNAAMEMAGSMVLQRIDKQFWGKTLVGEEQIIEYTDDVLKRSGYGDRVIAPHEDDGILGKNTEAGVAPALTKSLPANHPLYGADVPSLIYRKEGISEFVLLHEIAHIMEGSWKSPQNSGGHNNAWWDTWGALLANQPDMGRARTAVQAFGYQFGSGGVVK